MRKTESTDPLNIRVTSARPDWAQKSLAILAKMPAISLLSQDNIPASESIDVVLHYGEYTESLGEQFGYGRLGLWFFCFNHSDTNPITAARAAAAKGLSLEISLWTRFPDGRCECLYQSFGYLEPFAINRNVTRSLAKAAYFPARVLRHYQKNGILKTYSAQDFSSTVSPLAARLAEVLAIGRKIIQKLFWKEQWFVIAGTGNTVVPDAAPTTEWQLKPPADRFWADPFPAEWEGRQWVLVEELPFATMRGHLAAIELFADGRHGDPQPFMTPESHLSYPFIFTWNDALYLIPESSAAEEVVLWKCEQFPLQWQKVTTLLSGVKAADTTLIDHANHWWMFTAIAEKNACIHDELLLYFADSPLGPWQAHPQNPIKSDARNARPAGNLFVSDGVLYRPAQDCDTEYGKATVINRIDQLDTDVFAETPVARLDPGWRSDCTRTHTLSRFNNLWAVDGYRLLPRWAGWLNTQLKIES
ncbi:MAG: hypothetical protein QX197_16965 [Methylococcaceae bacterium]